VCNTIRVRDENIDLFGLFDVAALHSEGKELLLIQCKSTRCDNETRQRVHKLKVPVAVRKQIWIRRHGFRIKENYN